MERYNALLNPGFPVRRKDFEDCGVTVFSFKPKILIVRFGGDEAGRNRVRALACVISTEALDPMPRWAESDWVAHQRTIVERIHAKSKKHELGHPTFRDPEVEIINRIFDRLKDDEEATALLTHIVTWTHETASNPPR